MAIKKNTTYQNDIVSSKKSRLNAGYGPVSNNVSSVIKAQKSTASSGKMLKKATPINKSSGASRAIPTRTSSGQKIINARSKSGTSRVGKKLY
jgi:hypothetical protein